MRGCSHIWRFFLGLALLASSAAMAPVARAQIPVIEPEREQEVQGLLLPHRLGEAVGESEWELVGIAIEQRHQPDGCHQGHSGR